MELSSPSPKIGTQEEPQVELSSHEIEEEKTNEIIEMEQQLNTSDTQIED